MKRAVIASALVVILGATHLIGQQAPAFNRYEVLSVLEVYLESMRQQAGIPGMSAAIVRDGTILWERGFGFQDVARRVPATADTPYLIGEASGTLASVLLLQCVEQPSIPLSNELMSICDLTIATGGPAMVKAAYSSGKPAYGVGAGNATMVIDETADVEDAARNSAISKTNDHGSGCSADGNLLVDASIYDRMLERLQAEGGYLVRGRERDLLQRAYWDADGHRTPNTIARSAAASVWSTMASSWAVDRNHVVR